MKAKFGIFDKIFIVLMVAFIIKVIHNAIILREVMELVWLFIGIGCILFTLERAENRAIYSQMIKES